MLISRQTHEVLPDLVGTLKPSREQFFLNYDGLCLLYAGATCTYGNTNLSEKLCSC